MTDVEKGNKRQRAASKYLKSLGYVTHVTVRTSRKIKGRFFSQSNDIFNAIDIIATKFGEKTLWVQVTAFNTVKEKRVKIDKVPLDLNHNIIQIWAWHSSRRRLDKRYKDEKRWIGGTYFQVYEKTVSGWEMKHKIIVEKGEYRVENGEEQEIEKRQCTAYNIDDWSTK